MQPAARFNSVIEILGQSSNAPLDQTLSYYFKSRRYIGGGDRRFITEAAYKIIRNFGAVKWALVCAKTEESPRHILLAALTLKIFDESPAAIFTGEGYAPPILSESEQLAYEAIQGLDKSLMPEWAQLNYPEWMQPYLERSFGSNLTAEISALGEVAPLDLRVNTLKASREQVIIELAGEGITAHKTPHAEIGLRIDGKINLDSLKSFKNGLIEVQDEASQLAAIALAAKPGDVVIDYCAGGGGKTLAIAASMRNKGEIIALEVSDERFGDIKIRLKRAGVSIVKTRLHNTPIPNAQSLTTGMADRIFIDAPCSGSGTWRRTPDAKWRLRPEDINNYANTQLQILQDAGKLLKPGGTLLYATCSIFREENEDVVEKFLYANPAFALTSSKRLSPHSTGTDGFFWAILVNS